MSEQKSNHVFTVNLEGLNLSEEHLQKINVAVQKAVMAELATVDLVKTQGGLLSRFSPIWRGIWFVKNLEQFNV